MNSFLNINPWTQFYVLRGRKDRPLSYADHVTMRNCTCRCETYFDVMPDEEQYRLSEFTFAHLRIKAKKDGFSEEGIAGVAVRDVQIEIENGGN